MKNRSIDGLAASFFENGFRPHEAALRAMEDIDGGGGLVVMEGNTRIAALKRPKRIHKGEETGPK